MKKTRLAHFVLCGLAVILMGFGCSAPGNEGKPPNFIIVFTDEKGYQDLQDFNEIMRDELVGYRRLHDLPI
jgi:hypothetical protein